MAAALTRPRTLDPLPLLAVMPGSTDRENAELLGIQRSTIRAWRQRTRIGIRVSHADRHAVALGYHPAEVWGDAWWDATR